MSQPIGTPRNARGKRTRAAILDAAWELLAEEGPSGATMSAIAKRAGVSRRGLYLHFQSRTPLLIEVIDRMNQALGLEESLRPIIEARSGLEALHEWVRHLVEFHSQIHPVVEAVDRERRTDPDAAAMAEVAMEHWYGGCLLLARKLADQGRLRTDLSVTEAADGLWALIRSFGHLWTALVVEKHWSADRFRDFLLNLTLSAFVHPQPET